MPSTIEFKQTLLQRYDQPGPRYTSYPTAPHLREDFGATEYAALVQRGNDDPVPRPLSLYLHIPFCTSPCFYCGCHRVITRDRTRGEDYLVRLLREVSLQAELVDADRTVRQIHLGGGTPTFLTPAQLDRLLEGIASNFRLAPATQREVAIEIDPRSIDTDDLARLRSGGFNRVSFGVQDFDPQVQQAINRVQPAAQTLSLIACARREQFHSINVDLIYGLPRQTPARFEHTLDAIIDAAPGRIALYGYAHLPQRFKAQRQIRADELPAAEQRLEIFQRALQRLADAGYEHIGMDHFARPEDELARARRNGTLIRNFQGYAAGGHADILGLGVTAISETSDGLAQNTRSLSEWNHQLDRGELAVARGLWLSPEDRLRGELIQSIMCHRLIHIDAVERRHGIHFSVHFQRELQRLHRLQDDGLVLIDRRRIEVTPAGQLLLRVVASVFDAWLTRSGPATPITHSRMV